MLKGTIKFFLSDKKYGFILSEENAQEVYFHQDQLSEAIREGDQVLYELQENRKGPIAINISIQHDSMCGEVGPSPEE